MPTARTSDVDETKMSFEGYVRITNNSGEDYADARIRMVVGTISLVERIEDLARQGLISRDDASHFFKGEKKKMSERARRVVHDELEAAAEIAPNTRMALPRF